VEIRYTLEELFKSAQENGQVEFIYTLLRLQGLQSNYEDPLINLKSYLEKGIAQPLELKFKELKLLTMKMDVYCLIANLIRCSLGKLFKFNPFYHLFKGNPFSNSSSDFVKIINELSKICDEAKMNLLGEQIRVCFPSSFFIENTIISNSKTKIKTYEVIFDFLSTFLNIYFDSLVAYQSFTKVFAWPRFEVFELLVNDNIGLYGFSVHFSNGSRATFARHQNWIECTNLLPGEPIGFMSGFSGNMRREWMIGDKYLYEIGLSGRYNELGHWKPLIFSGDYDKIEKDVSLMSDDDNVRAILFYMRCTGYRVIEFVVRTNIELPWEDTSFSDDFHLWKCPPMKDYKYSDPNTCIYDGWLELKDVEPEAIKSALMRINIGINRMAFAYDNAVNWRLKYSGTLDPQSKATPSENDLDILDSLLRNFPKIPDAKYLEGAIDWYNSGKSSKNIFNEFLCYYISLECVATPVAEGKADFGFQFHTKSKTEKKEERNACINNLFNKHYVEYPAKFIRESYFNCIVGLKEKQKM
jgi:hypothetical protein